MSVTRPIQHPDPDVSVVIPTIPKNEYVPPLTLQEQTVDRYEVVVVSDASINRCEARNKGMKTANADIVAQTDDDCEPPTDWLERILSQFQSEPDTVLIEGFLDKLDTSPRGYVGANLAYKKDSAMEIGGFDTELSGWRADTDFGWRMENKYGIRRCRADKNLIITHIGPLRTTVNRELEKKFRQRHPKKYFTILYYPNIIFGENFGFVIAIVYSLIPAFVDRVIDMRTMGQ